MIPRDHDSLRVVEKLGLRSEGIAKWYLEIDGGWEEHAKFAATVEEWGRRRADLLGEGVASQERR